MADTVPLDDARKQRRSQSKRKRSANTPVPSNQTENPQQVKGNTRKRTPRKTNPPKRANTRVASNKRDAARMADAFIGFMNDFKQAHLIFSDPGRTSRKKAHRAPRRRQQKSNSSFLSLPAEIRNHIYSYVFSSARILVSGSSPKKERAALQRQWENHDRYVKQPRYRLGHVLDNGDIDDGLDVSPSLLLVSRAINKEVELFMYSRLTFCFDSMKVIKKFLNVASKQGIKEIRNLELYHTGYGQPVHVQDIQLKIKHDRKWRATCERIAEEIVSLDSLKLDITIRDWPTTLTENDGWWKTLKSLSKTPLDRVEARLQHPMVGGAKVAEASRRLEDCMMTEKGKNTRDEKEANAMIQRYYEAEAERLAKLALLPPLQARKVLSIVVENRGETNGQQQGEKEVRKYYNTHTEGFAVMVDTGGRTDCCLW